MPEYIDIHSHLNFPNYDPDREEVIEKIKNQNIWTISVGTNALTSKQVVELAHLHENLFACVGVHPTDEVTSEDLKQIEDLIKDKKVVAIGECGLDYYRSKDVSETKKKQSEIFIWHIEQSLKTGKPLMIHCRDAYVDTYTILESYKKEHGDKLKGNMHFFSGSVEIAKLFLSLDFTLSFAGPITFARNYDEAIRFAPLEMIMSETDAPFASPNPYRGRRNEPAYVTEIVQAISTIRGEPIEKVKKALVSNAFRVFDLGEKG